MNTVINDTIISSTIEIPLPETESSDVRIVKCEDCTFYIYISVGVCGIIILIIIIINLIVCCCCCKRKRRRRKRPAAGAANFQIPEIPSEAAQNEIMQQISENQQATSEIPNSKSRVNQNNGESKPQTPTKTAHGNSVKEKNTVPASSGATTAAAGGGGGGGKKNGGAGKNSSQIVKTCSTQPSLSLDITQPKTESEMTPDELEYLAFSILDSGKRFRIFSTAVKMAEKIAESHGFWINDRDPTVPGNEEDWLQKEADNIVRTCVEIHGVPVPDFGANKSEYLDYIERHSLREIYQIALYTEVDDITRMFFLNAVIERFREVVRKLPAEQLEKCQHPIPLLYRIYKEHPDIFEFKPKKHEKPKKQKK